MSFKSKEKKSNGIHSHEKAKIKNQESFWLENYDEGTEKMIEEIISRLRYRSIRVNSNFHQQVNQVLLPFLEQNQLIIFGKYALQALLERKKNLDYQIPINEQNFIPDHIQVYSDNARKYSMELVHLLHQAGLPLLKAEKHKLTGNYLIETNCRVILEFRNLYNQSDAYQSLLANSLQYKSKRYSGHELRYLTPEMLKLQLYIIFSDPRHSIDIWKDTITDLDLLEKYYPVTREVLKNCSWGNKVAKSDIVQALNKIYWKLIFKNKRVIVIGGHAYNTLVKLSKVNRKEDRIKQVPINNYVILSLNPEKTIEDLYELLGKKNIDLRYQRNFLGLHGTKYSIKYHNFLVLEIYDISQECVPFNLINEVQIANYHTMLRFLYIGIWLAMKTKNKSIEKKMFCMIYGLQQARDYYLTKQGKIGLEEGPFKVFHIECIGTQKNFTREAMIKQWNRKGEKAFRYRPNPSG